MNVKQVAEMPGNAEEMRQGLRVEEIDQQPPVVLEIRPGYVKHRAFTKL
jgi:hypothetical protein